MPTALPEASISFPMLGDFSISPTTYFTLFGHRFYWYGLIIAIGFLLAVWYACSRAPEFGLKGDDIIDMLLLAVPLGIVGARAYYVIFDWGPHYSENLWNIFKVWEGGLAIYGGVIGAVIGLVIVGCVKRMGFSGICAMLDVGAFGLLIGQAVGRWGNFINREAFGSETDIFCRMGLTMPGEETIYVHPTFLYESLWNLAGFLWMHLWSKKRKRAFDGQCFCMYLAWYGLGRFFIEGLRTDSLMLGPIRFSQLLAALTCVAALILIALGVTRRRQEHVPLLVELRRPETIGILRTPEDPATESAGPVGASSEEQEPEDKGAPPPNG